MRGIEYTSFFGEPTPAQGRLLSWITIDRNAIISSAPREKKREKSGMSHVKQSSSDIWTMFGKIATSKSIALCWYCGFQGSANPKCTVTPRAPETRLRFRRKSYEYTHYTR